MTDLSCSHCGNSPAKLGPSYLVRLTYSLKLIPTEARRYLFGKQRSGDREVSLVESHVYLTRCIEVATLDLGICIMPHNLGPMLRNRVNIAGEYPAGGYYL